jgi:hypothetical protein
MINISLPKPTMPDDIPPYTEEELHPSENWDFFDEKKALETYTKWREKNMEHDYIKNDIAQTNKLYSENDPINPNHYKHLPNGLETIDIIKAWTKGLEGIEAVCTANAIKYISRWKYKNGIEDLKKARWYLSYIIDDGDETKASEPVSDSQEKLLDTQLADCTISQIISYVKQISDYYDNQILFHLEWYTDGLICVGEFDGKCKNVILLGTDTIRTLRMKLITLGQWVPYGEGEEDE